MDLLICYLYSQINAPGLHQKVLFSEHFLLINGMKNPIQLNKVHLRVFLLKFLVRRIIFVGVRLTNYVGDLLHNFDWSAISHNLQQLSYSHLHQLFETHNSKSTLDESTKRRRDAEWLENKEILFLGV